METFVRSPGVEKGSLARHGKKGSPGKASPQTTGREMTKMAYELDEQYGIMTRVGLHCAPSAHKTLGTYPAGTIRFSFGWWNTGEDVETAVAALDRLTKEG